MSRLRNLTLLIVLASAALIDSPAQVFKKITKFDGKDGRYPQSMLVQGLDGELYGTTSSGGGYGAGEVFKISATGALTVLHSFNGTDGSIAGELTLASNGSLYGTTYSGGTREYGTFFRVTTKGELTVLYDFGLGFGAHPFGPLVQGPDGNLYGTSVSGGSGGTQCGGYPCGEIFRVTLNGTLTTLHTFCLQTGCPDGAVPEGGLVQGKDGSFYGTTDAGGGGVECSLGCGTVFKIDRGGALTTLYRFCQQSGCPDGSGPAAKLVLASDGNFYGTTTRGGVNGYFGTIFRLTPEGSLTTIYSFDGSDGAGIYAPLIQATDGYLYGAALQGGDLSCNPPDGCGTIFQVDEEGDLNVLHVFEKTDGDSPQDGLMQATSGILYGTSYFGGGPKSDAGTIFGLSMRLGPFVSMPRNFGKVGRVEGILGQNFVGTTDVVFNGVAADFTVKSNSLILATVPSGATSGFVTVTTPSGMLTSNLPFYVLH